MELENLKFQFKTDEKKRRLVEMLRAWRPQLPPSSFQKEMARLPLICPGKAVRRHRDGSEDVTYNGIVLLEIDDLPNATDAENIKNRVKGWPTTLAAMTGFSGMSVKVLVAGTLEDGSLPKDEELICRFHERLYTTCAQVYTTLIGRPLKTKDASANDRFRWTDDPTLFLNPEASPVRISRRDFLGEPITADIHEYDPELEAPSVENHSYYRRRFSIAFQQAMEKLQHEKAKETGAENGKNQDKEEDVATLLNATAFEALCMNIPQEETVQQALWNIRFQPLGFDFIRAAIESTYAENRKKKGSQHGHAMQAINNELQDFFRERYDLRFNELTNGVEWRRNSSGSFTFTPLDTRMMNTMIQECHEAGIECFDRDMKRYLGSSRIRDFNAARSYLHNLEAWDGCTDYIGAMADRVPTDSPHWRERFHTWFLGMVAQWDGWNLGHGNSVVPLLIGTQGCGKSTFGQMLLPPELRQMGYRELVDFTNKQEAERMLTNALLINLDEFNQISEKIQQGFLKNLIQKTSVKGRRPYSNVTVNLPRFASFIATTNMPDALSDPSGSRRFIIADIADGRQIDLSGSFHYDAMYAQAMAELNAGRRHYFSPEEVAAIETDNTTFTTLKPEVRRFLDIFKPATERSNDTEALRLTEIVEAVKQQTGYVYSDRSFHYLGRWLTSEAKAQRIRKTMHNGSPVYLVKKARPIVKKG